MNNIESYDDALMEASLLISTSIEEFSDLVVKMSLSGEYAEISDLFNEGDDVMFSVGDFLKTSDKRVAGIIKLLNCLRDVQEAFI